MDGVLHSDSRPMLMPAASVTCLMTPHVTLGLHCIHMPLLGIKVIA